MFKDSFLFELKYRLKSAGTWICFIGLLLMSYREMLAGEWDLLIQSGRVARNSPYTVYYLFMYYTFWAATVGSALMIPTLLRDLKSGTAELLYSFPLHSKQYFLGKYCASILIFILVMSSVAVGFITMPFITTAFGTHPATDFVATPWAHIGHAFLLWVLPACLVYGTLTFVLTALSGRPGPVYGLIMLAVGLFVTITAVYGDGSPKSSLVQILDPLGKVAVEGQIYYWTAEERMSKFLVFEGSLMQNRLLYLGIALLAFLFGLAKFDVRQLLQRAKNRDAASSAKKRLQVEQQEQLVQDSCQLSSASATRADKLNLNAAYGYWLSYACSAGWQLFKVVLTNKAFYLSMLTLILMLVLAGFSYQTVEFEGSGKLLPKAFILLPALIYPSLIFTLVAAAFFAIEICDREKSYRLDQLVGACPVPTWSIMLSKVVGVSLMAFALALVPISAVLIIQYGQGFFATNWAVLSHVTLLVLLPLMLAYGLIAVICYAVFSHKALAQSVAVILCITPAIFNEVKTVENFMYLWAWPFFVQLSDFDASGQYLQRNISFTTYWLSFYALLLVVAYWLWPRGTNLTFKAKWREAYHRIHPVNLLLACAFSGVFIWHLVDIHQSMIVANEFQTSEVKYAKQADYERRYGATRNDVQPKITAADLTVELYPAERKANYAGKLTIENKASEAVNELVIHYAADSRISQLIYNQQLLQSAVHDPVHNRLRYILPSPLVPGETALLEMTLAVEYHDFSNDEFDYHGTIVADGSYFSANLWPTFGYDKNRELQSVGLRQKHGLPAKHKALASVAEIQDFVESDDADFVNTRITISTEQGQFALASGKLIEQKSEAGRVSYVYLNDEPTLWQPDMVSAKYQLSKELWQPEDGGKAVEIEVYHHPVHQYNVPIIIAAARQALTQGYQLWGEFPYSTLRIAELPNGMTAARVSGNLLIIPENNVWLHDYRQPPAIDWITFQIARDASKVWWQQLAVADTNGHKLLTEAVPALQGLKAIEDKWGDSAQVAFVDLLSDVYLRQRTSEDQIEATVMDLTNEDYASTKAALALYSSYQLLDADKFEQELKLLFNHYRGKSSPPYADIDTVFELLTKASTVQNNNTLSQLFNSTGYYDFQVVAAKVLKAGETSEQGYQLQANLLATAFVYQAGKEQETDYQGQANVKVLGGDTGTDVLFEQHIMFKDGHALLELDLARKPTQVIVNPDREFIERSPSNNVFNF